MQGKGALGVGDLFSPLKFSCVVVRVGVAAKGRAVGEICPIFVSAYEAALYVLTCKHKSQFGCSHSTRTRLSPNSGNTVSSECTPISDLQIDNTSSLKAAQECKCEEAHDGS
jgi:hypothetical protein